MDILKKLEEFDEKLSHFPDGRIDFHGASEASALNIVIFHNGQILLLKRSEKVLEYKSKWNVVGGYLDEIKPIKKKALEELSEELGIVEDDIADIRIGECILTRDESISITWYIVPVRVILKRRPEIKLDFEHTDYRWINPEDIFDYDTVPNLDAMIDKARIK